MYNVFCFVQGLGACESVMEGSIINNPDCIHVKTGSPPCIEMKDYFFLLCKSRIFFFFLCIQKDRCSNSEGLPRYLAAPIGQLTL